MVSSAASIPVAAVVPAARDDLCLEYANTLCWRGNDPPKETLHGPADLLRWGLSTGAMDAEPAEALEARWRERTREATRVFAEAIALREAIYRIFSAVALATEPAADDLVLFNRALARAPARVQLRPIEGGYGWAVAASRPTASSLLATVLWSAGDLLAESRLRRVRRCANERCQWLFLDDSKGGTRRWCSMSTCGNRAKAHRHYLRHRQG